MKTTLSLVVLASLLSAPAFAREFATPGVMEVGGAFELANGTRTDEPEDGDKTTTKSSRLVIRPQLGFFAAPKIEAIGGLVLANSSTDDDGSKSSANTFGLRAGAAYFVNLGAHVGPQLLVGYDNTQLKDGGAKSTLSGPAVDAALVAKVPFAQSGLFQVGLVFNFAPQKLKAGGDDPVDYTTQSYGISTGFSAYF